MSHELRDKAAQICAAAQDWNSKYACICKLANAFMSNMIESAHKTTETLNGLLSSSQIQFTINEDQFTSDKEKFTEEFGPSRTNRVLRINITHGPSVEYECHLASEARDKDYLYINFDYNTHPIAGKQNLWVYFRIDDCGSSLIFDPFSSTSNYFDVDTKALSPDPANLVEIMCNIQLDLVLKQLR
jgi:hypothetical protein